MEWKPLRLLIYPKFRHACGVLRSGNEMVIVVAGGYQRADHVAATVEMLSMLAEDGNSSNVTDKFQFGPQWEIGPSLPTPLSLASSVTTFDQQALYVIGGSMGTIVGHDNSREVFKFSCSDLKAVQCEWYKLDYELRSPSSAGLALLMPRIPFVSIGYLDSGRECGQDISDDESILMVTTGWNGYYRLGDTENLIVVSEGYGSTYVLQQKRLSRCQPPKMQSMYPINYATGSLLFDAEKTDRFQQHIPIVCGGEKEGMFSDKCYRLETRTGNNGRQLINTAKPGALLNEFRKGAASISVLDRTTMWVTGGRIGASGTLSTTEWLDLSMITATSPGAGDQNETLPTLAQGIPLPRPLAYHCLEKINSNMAIVYGGTVWSEPEQGFDALATAWTIQDLDAPQVLATPILDANDVWTPAANMTRGRYLHSCGVVRDTMNARRKFVVAAGGGTNSSRSVTYWVELLKVDEDDSGKVVHISDSWQEGPWLPTALAEAASATSDDQTLLFVAGGHESFSAFVPRERIFNLKCVNDFCRWTEESAELMSGRTGAIAFIIPPPLGQ